MDTKDAVYLDHNATTTVRSAAADAMAHALAEGGNASSVHKFGRRARKLVEDSRDAVAALTAEQRARPTEVPYNYLLIDCPPSLNLLTLNAMVAAHAVLVPVQCEFFALEGISQLKQTIDQIKATLNPALEIQGVVLTMHDARTSLSKEVATEVRAFFGPKVYDTMIPRNIRVAEAPSHGKPILIYDYDCPGSQAYIQLANEIIQRERQLRAA